MSNHAPSQTDDPASHSTKPLVFFIHGFPDSWAIWRHVVSSEPLQDEAVVVCLDLPGFGGSDTMKTYSTTNLLEALTEFILTLRAAYGIDTAEEINKRKVVIVAHDWGCVLAMLLAAEAPDLADRFILSNGVLVINISLWVDLFSILLRLYVATSLPVKY